MIFVTVGSQLPFDRMVVAVDAWARRHPDTEVIAQIGQTRLVPTNMRGVRAYTPGEFASMCASAQLIVAHAGMGSILTALQYGKPIVVMPRKGALRETRNDHQIVAARWLRSLKGVHFADDETTLAATIDLALARLMTPEPIATHASDSLLEGLRAFIDASSIGKRG